MADAGATLAAVGDPTATRTVYVTIAILISLGVAMALLAVWVFRRTRPEPELLAPLEAMESRAWRRLDPATQRRLLDEARPSGAVPLMRQPSVPKLDKEFSTVAPVASFDDLADDDFDDDFDDAFGIGLGIDGPPTQTTPTLDLLDDDIDLPEDVDPVVAMAESEASDMAALEIDDPVAAGRVLGVRIDGSTADDFGNELEFPPALDAEHDDDDFDDELFADEVAPEPGADPLITRRGRADSDRR